MLLTYFCLSFYSHTTSTDLCTANKATVHASPMLTYQSKAVNLSVIFQNKYSRTNLKLHPFKPATLSPAKLEVFFLVTSCQGCEFSYIDVLTRVHNDSKADFSEAWCCACHRKVSEVRERLRRKDGNIFV